MDDVDLLRPHENPDAPSLDYVIRWCTKNNLHWSIEHNILVAGNGFHGRTLGALSATESPKYRKGFEPLLPSFDFAPLNDIEAFDRAINDNTSAVLVESIQGEGGIFVADDSFLQELSAICSQRKVMLLLDEVQAGIGRTGEFLGFQKSGILPSAVAMAKGLGGGFPIGAIWINEEYANTFGPGSRNRGGHVKVILVTKHARLATMGVQARNCDAR